ncbi:hypothetical protein BJI45_03225 [Limosilactobacillus reuteri]|uniref:Uncharacterized protein n=1 Tax=Limosilactobacillus reuteri TaxID=1598 RepID=A0AB36I3N3_LIMRT|nr:hypothetical protein [Limosilactobacillus reuteri]OJI11226.1 hypothetical protein BJI45_03225 [Limosilactobacillus reuteri]
MTTSMVHSRSMLAKVIAESPSPFIIPIFYPNVIKIIFLSINYFMKRIKSNQKADFNNFIKLIEEKIIII